MKPASAAQVRAWARRVGLTVGTRGHLPVAVIEKFNRRNRAHHAESHNPFLRGVRHG